MRRITYWVLSTVSVLVLLFGYHTSTAGPLPANPSSAYVAGTTPGTTSSTSSNTSGRSGSSSSTSGSGTSVRTVTGDVASTQWGPVQVQLTVDSGKITQAKVLQYPSGSSQDQQINAYALPILVQETVDAQSAGIDMVSGATVTSNGYLQSLQSALDQAGL
jgi:uncharacterized protein with FMN-binding domain